MPERVLDDGLEDEVGDGRVERLRFDLHVRREAILKAHAFDFEITAEEFQLLLQGDFLRARVLQSQAEEVAEPCDHAVGALRVRVDERRDGVERVKEKVRARICRAWSCE